MRQSIILLVIVLLAVAAYTAYGLVTFQPDTRKVFTFAEPTLPPEMEGDFYRAPDESRSADMTQAQKDQTTAAMAQLSQAVTLYQNYEKDSGEQAASTFKLINTAVINGKLPAYLLSQNLDANRQRSFELITLDPKKNLIMKSGQDVISCASGASSYDVLTGDNGNNRLECNVAASNISLDRIFLGGPGDDVIVSAQGNRIINAGTGDDTITAGPGRTIIMLEDGWGKDTLTVDCNGTQIDKAREIPPGFPIPWVQTYTNFIVLSPRITPADIAWQGNVLTNKTTGDTLTVNQNCFNLVSASK